MQFKRYTLNDVSSNQFYQLPKFLFEGELKANLSNDAKVLYALLRDRHTLSIANKWVDKNNDVYIIYTRAEMGDMLGCSKQKIINLCNELKKNNLFEEVRQGLNKPNLIYLNYFDFESNILQVENKSEKGSQTPSNKEVYNLDFQKSKNHTSRGQENRLLEVPILDSINTNPSYTEFSKTDHHQIITHDEVDDIDMLVETLKNNIGYDIAKATRGEQEYIDNILNIMIDVICSNSPTVRVGKENKPQAIVKSQFMKLDYCHIQYVCLCLSETTCKITYIKPYLITALYNAPQTMDIYYSQRVQHDINT